MELLSPCHIFQPPKFSTVANEKVEDEIYTIIISTQSIYNLETIGSTYLVSQ